MTKIITRRYQYQADVLNFNRALECKTFVLFCLLDTAEFFVNCHKKQLYNVPFKELFLQYCPFIRIWKHYLSGVPFLVEILNVLFPRLCDCCRTYLSNKTFVLHTWVSVTPCHPRILDNSIFRSLLFFPLCLLKWSYVPLIHTFCFYLIA